MKVSNEIKVLRAFLVEFNPFYADERILKEMTYGQLVDAVKETVKEM